MMAAGDYMLTYVLSEHRKEFKRWGKWWDSDFSLYVFYDMDLLHTLNDYAKGN